MLPDVDDPVDLFPPCGIVRDEVGYSQTGDVEGLAGGVHGDCVVLVDRGHRGEVVPWHLQLAVDLVADDDHSVAAADFSNLLEVFLGPDSSAGVVGVAEQKDFGHRVGGPSLKILEINVPGRLVTFCVVDQLVGGELAAVVADRGEEAVVGGGLDDHLRQFPVRAFASVRLPGDVAFGVDLVVGQCLYDDAHPRYDPVDRQVPFFFRVPASAALPPVDGGFVVAVGNMCVAEYSVINPAAQNLYNLRRDLEVHIGHPEGDDILADRPSGALGVPFHAVCAASDGHLVKIVLSHIVVYLIY